VQLVDCLKGEHMRIDSFFKTFKKKQIKLSENQLISIKGKNLKIDCLKGAVWVTAPQGFEQIIKKGQTISVSSRGKVCILAFSESYVQIHASGWLADRFLNSKIAPQEGKISPFAKPSF